MGRKKKLRCPNCGTVIKEDEKSCSICHMVVERPEEEIEEQEVEEIGLKEKIPTGKIVMGVVILIGIILTIKGSVEFQNSAYCRQDDCEIKSLFMAGMGVILIIAASISIAWDGRKSKKA